MPRKKYEEEPDSHDRWLVSYADLITLLFAFFVVMYAISSVNEGKYRVFSNSLLNAFGSTPLVPAIGDGAQISAPLKTLPPPSRNTAALRREKESLTRVARETQSVLASLVDQGKVRVTQTDRGVTVEINASVLFAQGSAKLAPESSSALKAVAAVLKDDTHAIQVEGHTDSVPISNVLFASNWELSSVRAGSVVRLFIENGIAEQRLTAVGRGATRPVESNDTVEGRMRNRRVTVMILSRADAPVEPASIK